LKRTVFPVLLIILLFQGPVRAASILFDHTKNETAGNADWVIDNNEPAPSPAQSGIGAATAETYWTGAISAWGVGLVKLGHTVATLATTDSITYGRAGNPRDLSKYKVFVVCEPQNPFTANEKKAIFSFVRNGGGLFMVADHDGSDRDNDGWDSPMVWDSLGIKDSFGLYFDISTNTALSNFSESSRSFNTTAGDSIISGPAGHADTLAFHNGSAITLFTALNATAQKHFWRASNPAAAMCASARFGTGKVVGIGDSSPADDSTGNSGNTLYDGWSEGEDSILFLNATAWLAAGGAAGVAETLITAMTKGSFLLQNKPNPFSRETEISYQTIGRSRVTLGIYNISGQLVRNLAGEVETPGFHQIRWDGRDSKGQALSNGVYVCRITAGSMALAKKMILVR
jgi:hypothetical protein